MDGVEKNKGTVSIACRTGSRKPDGSGKRNNFDTGKVEIFFRNRSCPRAGPCHTLAQPLPSVTPSPVPSYIVGVLPARWGSTRFPGKPLHLIAGKPLIQHVWERCKQCSGLDEIIVAVDDERIRDAVLAFGGKVAMTSPDHPTGTDRIAEALQAIPQATHIINIQGDEPLID